MMSSTRLVVWRNTLLPLALLSGSVAPTFAQQRQPQPQVETSLYQTSPQKIVTSGIYTDATGGVHNWSINERHTLLWDTKPYFPVGGRFIPSSLKDPSEAAWKADIKALEALTAKGLKDLLIWQDRPLMEIPLPAFQRLISYLDNNQFQYGLSFGIGMTTPLTGTVVKPSTYRYDTRESLTAQWTVTNTDSALYYLYDISNSRPVLQNSIAKITSPVIAIPVEPPAGTGRTVALLYPHKTLPAHSESIPDLWSGFDAYRDKLISYLKQIKFGAGLRFFLDPLARHIGMEGETDYLIPDSASFQVEFEAWLGRQYPNLEEIRQNWGLVESDIKTHAQLAQLIPLWANNRGIPFYFDKQKRRSVPTGDTRLSKWWQDFLQFRNESILYYMNTMANLLKKQVVSVPVVYTWTQLHPIFLNPDTEGGYDGLSVALKSSDPTFANKILAPAYSALEQGKRTLWSLITEVEAEPALYDTPPDPNKSDNAPPTYTVAGALANDIDQSVRYGFKGYYFATFHSEPKQLYDWLTSDQSLTWLAESLSNVQRISGTLVNDAPQTLTFPQYSPGNGHYGIVPGTTRVLWMGRFVQGEALDWWPAYSGYSLKNGDSVSRYVIQSLRGPRKTHFVVGRPKDIFAFRADGTPVPIKVISKDVIEVVLDDKPTIFVPNKQTLFPAEAAFDTIIQFQGLTDIGVRQKVTTGLQERARLEQAKNYFAQRNFEIAFIQSRPELDEIIDHTVPYIWIEGERPFRDIHTFTEVALNVEASRGSYLKLQAQSPPGRFGYGVRYNFDVLDDGRYNVWLAGSIPGRSTSPFRWRMNSEPERDPETKRVVGERYLGQEFGWTMLGTANLKKGPGQSISLYVIGPNQAKQEYSFAIDAIMITPAGFTPNGTIRPVPLNTPLTGEKFDITKRRP